MITEPFDQSYEDYLSDEPDAYGLPDGLTRQEYERLQREANRSLAAARKANNRIAQAQ